MTPYIRQELEMDYFSGKRKLLQRSPYADRYRRAEAGGSGEPDQMMPVHSPAMGGRQQRSRNAPQWD
ncbi:hypothetical protein FLT15_31275 [Paenibacillus thiaminolyticus]|uniref:hypothetical protein n=1 Tax=Paenibacillus thiaminolyticus TaxID=49283 RepID=UPI00116546D7|nr:hypothetical protein [Paenibacillus thiaminolyticus]NGP62658.1 hypothetical protein [Paenibacillus thiaminolyticus]